MKILLIDNYDSFTWNLHHLLVKADAEEVIVVKNDLLDMGKIAEFDAIVLSPGPGLPSEAGRMKEVISRFAGVKKILGICLGHQAIAEVFGGKLVLASDIYHGTATKLTINEQNFIFRNMPEEVLVGRYHSWIIDSNSFPESLKVTATDELGVIMAIRHRTLDITGVQFHPESILTPLGELMIRNWMQS